MKSAPIKAENSYSVIGLMSGTSLDGLDIAACYFTQEAEGQWHYKIDHATCVPYPKDLAERLNNSFHYTGYELIRFHKEYGLYLGEQVNTFIQQHKIKAYLIASHGHTVFHNPAEKVSFQLGDGAAIYAVTGLPAVCDFRAVDVLSGGQGAPLVPIGDKLLFGQYRLCLNLGGIANISYDDSTGRRVAFDVTPCNLLLNKLANEAGLAYDKDGALASRGKVNEELLKELLNWPFFSAKPPKSLDKEQLLKELWSIISESKVRIEDKLVTVAQLIATQIAEAVRPFYKADDKMLMTGGGAFNKYLVEQIHAQCKGLDCIVPDRKIVEFKEALIFAFLGLLRMHNKPNALASVTGARGDSLNGSLYGNTFYKK